MPDVKNVLFLCAVNSARSLMVEAILTREGMARFLAVSAGPQPVAAPHLYTLELPGSLTHQVGRSGPGKGST